jgi:hypothetical protein
MVGFFGEYGFCSRRAEGCENIVKLYGLESEEFGVTLPGDRVGQGSE